MWVIIYEVQHIHCKYVITWFFIYELQFIENKKPFDALKIFRSPNNYALKCIHIYNGRPSLINEPILFIYLFVCVCVLMSTYSPARRKCAHLQWTFVRRYLVSFL